ncbi:unnamed protein product [Ilex paraguariensis]|uniref:Germin-like protein n=1 Tax=Ilex paraguariensis TaxID=185542 RepID=A0ABC8UF36_9AQUA
MKTTVAEILAYVAFWAMVSFLAYTSDPSPLQDFRVAVNDSKAAVIVAQIGGLNTLGISMAYLDFAPYGLNPPHTHPCGTEILTVMEGALYVGFVTSNPNNRLTSKVLCQGDVFVFPIGLIHFQLNVGNTPAVAIGALSNQNPGVITIANAVFKSKPPISVDVLTEAFQVDKNVVNYLQVQLWIDNNGHQKHICMIAISKFIYCLNKEVHILHTIK